MMLSLEIIKRSRLYFDIPVYKRIGAVYAESNPELETNSAVQAQWDYFKREHHKSRRAYIKKL